MYQRRYPVQGAYTNDQAHELVGLSHDIGRQLGVIIDRQGRPYMVIVGDTDSIYIPELTRARQASDRLRGLRLMHTHLKDQPLSNEDLMDLLFLRLDSFSALSMDNSGQPATFYFAHLLPANPENEPYEVFPPMRWDHVDLDLNAIVQALEDELARVTPDGKDHGTSDERALLVSVSTQSRAVQESNVAELADLAETAGLNVMGTMLQRIRKLNPKFIMGKGKLAEMEVKALQSGAGVILFDRELSPAQMRNLANLTERKVLDRTQLIMDIFARRATTRAGKLQVEMAQLQYTLPRLVGKNKALSKLMGGIGGRGPGETKLELDRRRVRARMAKIRDDLRRLRKQRASVRARRAKAGLPVCSLVGYTNAGKSTLLNQLTSSDVLAENKLFATLDPTTRRLRFPEERELILTDTVGFIRELPVELKEAFQATLEELESADFLLHVADASHAELEHQVRAVEDILLDMRLHEIPRVLVLNKWDSLSPEERELTQRTYPDAIPVSALTKLGLDELTSVIIKQIQWPNVLVSDNTSHEARNAAIEDYDPADYGVIE